MAVGRVFLGLICGVLCRTLFRAASPPARSLRLVPFDRRRTWHSKLQIADSKFWLSAIGYRLFSLPMLPHLSTQIPGPKSRELTRLLSKYENHSVTFLADTFPIILHLPHAATLSTPPHSSHL